MSTARRRVAGGLLAAAGAGLISGALLPWVSLYAGLVRHAGTTGTPGRLLLAAGAGLVLAGVATAGRRPLPPMILALSGLVLVAWTGWLLGCLDEVRHTLESQPMLVGSTGPGIPVAFGSALLVPVAWLVGRNPTTGGDARS